ncbi:MAG TPA: tRNA-dihydrouridine synthase family protein [Kofleriaceae bacterium]|nr:tRNA-dihydrouridine synthase family protein [Kofleriaceae bacterium]
MNPIAALLQPLPVVLAPMEDVTDAAFRAVCRAAGGHLCVTEFIAAHQLVVGTKLAVRRSALAPEDRPTAIQIYGANPDELVEAAIVASRVPGCAFVDINCGCWIPKIAARGAGAGWLRDPVAMVEMARRIVAAIDLPVTVKTRIGYGPESHMPIVDLARRLEDVGVAAIAIHCRTAKMAHNGDADWRWAARAREVVSIPVIVNGDVRTADDVVRALAETGCAGAMIGRAAMSNPWVFREARALLAGERCAPPTDEERRAVYRTLLEASIAQRGERGGVASAKRYAGMLPALRPALVRASTLDETAAMLG